MLKIGLTGGIGAGKTLVSRIFNQLGIPVYYADDRARWLMEHDTDLKNQISEIFGLKAYLPSGKLNRDFLAATIFNDQDQIRQLNQLVHPAVDLDYGHWLIGYNNLSYTLKEAALIFETGNNQVLDKVILVAAPLKVRIERVLMRDAHRSRSQVNDIIDQQMPENEKKELADFIIENDGTRLLIPQVLKLHQRLLDLQS